MASDEEQTLAAGQANWSDIPASEQQEFADFLTQYEQMVGYAFTPTDSQLHALATQHPTSFADFAQGMWGSVPASVQQSMPWAQWGLTHDSYKSTLNQYNTSLERMLGPYVFGFDAPGGAQDVGNLISQAFAKGMSTSDLEEAVRNNQALLATHGWLKFGLDYDTFQQQKQSMTTAFGHQLSDQEGVLQLQYYHSAPSGPTARAQGAQPAPQAQTGGQSVVR